MKPILVKTFLFFGLTALCAAAFAQTAPVVTYGGGTNTVSFIQGVPGSNSPTNTGGAVPAIAYGVVSTPYGSTTGASGNTNSTGNNALFDEPTRMVGDGAGNLYVADNVNNLIRKIFIPTGTVTTLAGSGVSGSSNGTGTGASFNSPDGICMDPTNTILYVSEFGNGDIRKIVIATGVVSSVTAVNINYHPHGLAIDAAGTNLYFPDYNANIIRKAVISSGAVTIYAGNGTAGRTNSITRTSAEFNLPSDVAFDASGNLFVADLGNNEVREINASGVTLFAGSVSGTPGSGNGTGVNAGFNAPVSISFDAAGNMYLSDFGNSLIRKITPAAAVTTLAGELGVFGDSNGTSFTTSSFFELGHLYIDASGNMYVPDYGNNNIRQLTICGYAISGTLPGGISFDATTGIFSGNATVTGSFPVVITAYNLYGSSTANVTINCTAAPVPAISYNGSTNAIALTEGINSSNSATNTGGAVPAMAYGVVSTPYGSTTGVSGNTNGTGNNASFNNPNCMVSDGAGNLYVADLNNNLIRKIATSTGIVTTLAGSGVNGDTDGTGTAASFDAPTGICIDPTNTILYVSDGGGIRKIVIKTAVVTTIPGTALAGVSALTIDATGTNLYAVNLGTELIRKVVISSGAVTTYAGNGTPGRTNSTSLTSAEFFGPADIALDAAGNLFVADLANNEIREINSAGVTLFAGSATGTGGATNGTGTAASFYGPAAISIDAAGNTYVDDSQTHLIRKITPAGVVTTLAGEDAIAGYTNGTTFTNSTFGFPNHAYIDASGNMYVPDRLENNIRQLTICGWAISGTLPTGISFDATTGILSGEPLVSGTFPVAITAYNLYGSSTANVTITCKAPTAPSISYTPNTENLPINTAITALSPANAGGAITVSSFGTGVALTGGPLNEPYGMAFDASGNLYVTNYATGTNNVLEYNTTTGAYTGIFIARTSFVKKKNPTGIVFDASGNAYVAEFGGYLYKFTSAGAYTSTVTTYPFAMNGIAIDASNNLYVADNDDDAVYKFSNSGTLLLTIPFSSTLNTPVNVAVDASGYVYVLDAGNLNLQKYTSSGVYVATLVSGLSTPYGLCLDSNGDIYIGDSGTGKVTVYNPAGTLITSITGLTDPRGLIVDAGGNLYVSDFTKNTITKYPPVYYNLSGGTLPANLSFDSSTGTFSGTPTINFVPINFTITANGQFGTSSSNSVTLSCVILPVFSYANPPVYTVGTAISNLSPTITSGGPITSATISPALPLGLSITSAGIITGTPTMVAASTVYTVTGTNATGGFSTATVTISVAAPPVFSYTNPPAYTVGTTISNLSPSITSGGPITSATISPALPSGLSITSAGIITGTPTVVATSNVYTVTATNAAGGTGTATVTISVAAPPVFSYTNPPAYTVGTTISNLSPTITSGGPITSATISPALPLGLSITSAGIITGAPTVVATSTLYTVTGTNASGGVSTATVTISVAAPPVFSYSNPFAYTVGTTISNLSPTITSGGPITSATINPTLPLGLSISSAGVISGKPTTGAATTTYTITATNSAGGTATATVTITVGAAPNISYNAGTNAITFTQGATSSSNPSNSGGAVPNTAYGLVTIPYGSVSGVAGNTNGTGNAALFNGTKVVVGDGAGNLYVVDEDNNLIRKIVISTGAVTTLAGSGAAGATDGTGTAASFNLPNGLCIDAAGANLYVSDYSGGDIRKIVIATGVVTTLASNAAYGPTGVTLDATGTNLYFADDLSNVIRRLALSSGVVTIYAGNGTAGKINSTTLTSAEFNGPSDIAFDAAGNLFVDDSNNNEIREINASGVTLFAGLSSGASGSANGTGTAASFNFPARMAFDANGNLYVGENNDIRKITQGAVVTTLSLSANSSFVYPRHMYIDQSGNMYVPDFNNNNISEFPIVGWAISGALPPGIAFDATTGILSGNATLGGTYNVAVTAYNLYGSSTANVAITVPGPLFSYVNPPAYTAGTAIANLSPTITGGGAINSATISPGLPAGLSINSAGVITGTPTTASPATFYTITAQNAAGNSGCATVVISVVLPPPGISYNAGTNVVAFVENEPGSSAPVNTGGAIPGMAYGVVTTPYGSTTGVAGKADGTGNAASFNVPCTVVGDGAGNLYVADTRTNLIRKIVISTGAVTTLAGSGAGGITNGIGTAATFSEPNGLCIDAAGANLYVSEYTGGDIRKIVIATGAVTTIATSSGPSGVAIDVAGENVYFPDFNSNVIYKVALSTGVKSIYAGSGAYGLTNGSLLSSNFENPADLAFDSSGNLFVSDYTSNEIREINAAGTAVTLFAGSPTGTAGSTDGTGSAASFHSPATLSFDWGGNLYTGDIRNDLIRKITPGGVVTTLAGEAGTPGFTNGASFLTSTFGYPYHPYVDPTGNMYVPDFLENNIRQLTVCGWAISGTLPTGINFDATTGILSGTATVTGSFPVVITAYNLYGSSTANVTINCSLAYDWTGTAGNDWNDSNNWESKTVPVAGSNVNIGVTYPFSNQPIVSNVPAAVTLGTLNFGNFGGKAPVLTVNSPNQLTFGDINKVSDANSGTTVYTPILAGTGAINAVNLNITANTAATSSYTEGLTSSIANLNLSGNVALTSTMGANAENAAFNITGGVTSLTGTGATGIISTSNQTGSTSTIAVSAGTLQWANATGLSGLSATGTNALLWTGTGVIGYSGANQTVYTDLPITGLAAGVSYQGISFSGTGIKTPNGGNLNVAGDFINAMANDAADYVSLTGTPVFFNGAIAQNIYAGSGNGTVFNNITFNGSGATTIQSGNAYIAPNGLLTMAGTATLAAGGFLTLNADATGCASIAPITSGTPISGAVNVQRYISGARGYRLLSSPVYAGTVGGNNVISMNYLTNNLYLTGSTQAAGLFQPSPATANPSLFLYDEGFVPQFTTFYNSNFIAVSSLAAGTGTTPSYTVNTNGAGLSGNFNVPAGNGYYVFYRGNLLTETTAQLTSPVAAASAATVTAGGTLNQGQVTVKNWYSPSSGFLGSASQHLDLVGNPYASAIDLNTIQSASTTTGIYTTPFAGTTPANSTGVSGFIYELIPTGGAAGNYGVWTVGGNSTTATNGASQYIGSGEGFFVQAFGASPNAQVIFNESAKATSANANAFGIMAQRVNNLAAVNTGGQNPLLRLQLAADSTASDETLITFKPTASAKYVFNEDAPHQSGGGIVHFASRSSDSIAMSINTLPLQAAQTIPLNVYAQNDGVYTISMNQVIPLPALYDIWLMDAYKKDSLDIKHNPAYNFDVLHSDVNSYGTNRFTLVIRQDPAMMVHLLSFAAEKAVDGDNVTWTTENEANYTNFAVQRSTDGGKSFTTLDALVSSGLGDYSYLDNNPVQGANAYRLQLTDLNGIVTYSGVVTIMYANTGNQIGLKSMTVFPNPTAGTVNLAINQPTAGANPEYSIRIVNNLGAVIKTAQSSSAQWQTDVSTLVPGTYFIEVTNMKNSMPVGKSAFVKL